MESHKSHFFCSTYYALWIQKLALFLCSPYFTMFHSHGKLSKPCSKPTITWSTCRSLVDLLAPCRSISLFTAWPRICHRKPWRRHFQGKRGKNTQNMLGKDGHTWENPGKTWEHYDENMVIEHKEIQKHEN